MSRDPIKVLQAAARLVAACAAPGTAPGRVVVEDAAGRVLFAVVVPIGAAADDEPEETGPVPGWSFSERAAFYDGKAVRVASSRLKLLRVLAEADAAIAAKELIGLAFDRHTTETNVRFHVGKLREELVAAFPGMAEEMIEADGGYRLAIR